MEPEKKREITIRLNSLRRMIKEVDYYQKEICKNEKKIIEMKNSGKDKYDIKKMEEILEESFCVKRESIKKLKNYRETVELICVDLETTNTHCEDSEKNNLIKEINELLSQSEIY